MDKIFLHGMKAETLIGVYEWERQQPQTLVIDLDIALPDNAGAQDDIAQTIHYGEVCQALRHELAQRNFLLLESLAQSIADFIFAQFRAPWVRIRITKPGILPRVAAVGVEIERHNPKKQPAP
ncbi:dihydroneopterin aldolase [Helicobacter pylori]